MSNENKMTREEMQEAIDVIKHFMDGCGIEFRYLDREKHGDSWWAWAGDKPFNFSKWQYRKKPEPLKLWVNIQKEGALYVHASEEKARSYEPWGDQYSRIAVPMIEVTE